VRRVELMREERERLKRDKSALNRLLAKVEFEDIEIEGTSKNVAEFFNVYKKFQDETGETIILDKFNVRIARGDRIGILGRNGSGKTTFLQLLTGELQPDSGKIKLARDIDFSYFDQKRRGLDPKSSLQQILCPSGGDHVTVMGKPRHVCGYLRDFLFDPTMASQQVSTLSGGQKNRLMLAKVLANPKSFLIMDEPTNDLDMDTLDMLEEVLINYKGTLLIVSHDRDFLDQTVSKILAFEGNGVVEGYIGGYTDYLKNRPKQKNARVIAASEKPQAPKAEAKPAQQKLSYKVQYEWENLPARIKALEAEVASLQKKLADENLYAENQEDFMAATKRFPEATAELEAAEMRWLELDEMMAKL
jgi:ATP-binding cassette subfamily F protein uup